MKEFPAYRAFGDKRSAKKGKSGKYLTEALNNNDTNSRQVVDSSQNDQVDGRKRSEKLSIARLG